MKKYSDKTHALLMAVGWTLLAILATAYTLYRDKSPLQIAIAALFAVDAIMWWITYAKKTTGGTNHE